MFVEEDVLPPENITEQHYDGWTPLQNWGFLVCIAILLLFLGWLFNGNDISMNIETIFSYITWPYYSSMVLAIILTVILFIIRSHPEFITTIKTILVVCIGIISFMTIFKIGQEYLKLLPDGLPWVGHLDEAAAGALFLKCLRYFDIDWTTLFDKD